MSRRGSPVPLFKSVGTKELKFVHGAFCHLCIAECKFPSLLVLYLLHFCSHAYLLEALFVLLCCCVAMLYISS